MCTFIKAFANTGLVNISTANTNLDGTGTLGTVLTATSTLTGTTISTIKIKATGDTSEGMVRLFINDGTAKRLYREVKIPANEQTSVSKAFEIDISEKLYLATGYSLLASTENAESFNIIAYATDWEQCGCGSSTGACGKKNEIGNTGIVQIDTANTNLNGTGSMGSVITATSGGDPLYGGLSINNVNIKSIDTISQGMVRLFIDNGSTKFLLTEVLIPQTTQSSVEPALRTSVYLGLYLEAGYSIYASTEVSDTFNISIDGIDIVNCNC